MRIPLRRSRHWCPSATSRVAEVAVPMQEYLAAARSMGITIVWAPSDVTDFYNTTVVRANTLRAPKHTRAPGASSNTMVHCTDWDQIARGVRLREMV